MAPSYTGRPEALTDQPRIALIGAGALGTALALRLSAYGLPPACILSRTLAHAASLAARVGAVAGSDPAVDLPEAVDIIICCVPDAALATLDYTLARSKRDWTGVLVLHTSGALPSALLAETAAAGAWTASLHPIQTFARGSEASAFDGISAGIEGPEPGFYQAWQLALHLGIHPLRVEAHLKGTYHLACALASNYVTTLLHIAAEALRPLGIGPADAQQVLAPLVDRALDALRHTSPGAALTGPLVRGDLGTLDTHLKALEVHAPERYLLYVRLVEATRDLAVSAGRLNGDQQHALAEWLLHRSIPREGRGDPGEASSRRNDDNVSSDDA